MVGSINNGFQQQPPIANTFKPGQELGNQNNQAQTNSNAGTATTQTQGVQKPTAATQTNEKFSLADNKFTQDSGNVSSSANRGSQLDISV